MQAFDAILLMVEHKIRLAAQEGKGEVSVPYSSNGTGLANCCYDIQNILQRRGFEVNIGGRNDSNGQWVASVDIRWVRA